MKIDYRIGDMFKDGHKYLVHGCNAQGVMGSGVALLVKEDYPYAYLTYRDKFDRVGLELGEVVLAKHPDGLSAEHPTIFNCITQNKYRKDKRRYVNYGAVQKCMRYLNAFFLIGNSIERVAMPMNGAGLGGGDWSIISSIIEEEAKNFQPVVYDLTP
jgi:O-acetyl-ADP-ribose deacetylase (regulator of RNase III)